MTKKSKRYRRKRNTKLRSTVIIILTLSCIVAVISASLLFGGCRKKNDEKSPAVIDPEFYIELEKTIYPLEYEEYVYKYSEEFSVPASIIFAVIKTESDFDTDAVSPANACGLMQLTKPTYEDCQRWLGEIKPDEDIFDVDTNIKYGTYYLSRLYNNLYKDWDLVYAAYNAGPGNVSAWLEDPDISSDGKLTDIPFEETEGYVRKVNKAREKYIELYELGE
ncbi:MAG: lytic transglycosylase domain-containing protein [Ruminococcaceae bacterium]|nr:lytic transglycosylase domain-containing protein [Oscillospiraceae bacterium]